MAKNNKKPEKNNELEIESATLDPLEPTDKSVAPPERPGEEPTEASISASADDEPSSDDLFEDVRRSLIEEEETDKNKKDAKWWHRLGKRQKNTEPDASAPIAEIDVPATYLETEIPADQKQATEPEESEQPIDD